MTAQKISLPFQKTKRRSFEFGSVTETNGTLTLSLLLTNLGDYYRKDAP